MESDGTPDESEVWESSSYNDPHMYIWSMLNPMTPKLIEQLRARLKSLCADHPAVFFQVVGLSRDDVTAVG